MDDLWDCLRLTFRRAASHCAVPPLMSVDLALLVKTTMNRYFDRRPLFNAFVFAVGLMAGLGAIGGADATDYNRLASKPKPVVELVPANQGPPVRIIATRPAF